MVNARMVSGPVTLVILDGWGIAPESYGNAIALANTPFFDQCAQNYPVFPLQASGEVVGLPWGEMGNSEVGHLSLGSGMILYQTFPRITRSIASRAFFSNEAFLQAFEHARKYQSTIHLVGLVSDGGVHSMLDHLLALLELCAEQKMPHVMVHAILDGRDTPKSSAERYLQRLQEKMRILGIGKIASISGRFYTMDRDQRWERIQKAYEAMVRGVSPQKTTDVISSVEASYEKGVFDEEFLPTVLTDAQGEPLGVMHDHDVVITTNFRPDRMRQLTESLTVPNFQKFDISAKPNDLFVVTMVEYDKHLPVNAVAFPPMHVSAPLAKVISDADIAQLHIAETEKYPHVTYFFNGGREETFPKEDRVLIPSVHVASYAEKPAMSAIEIRDRVAHELQSGKYPFVVVNFANADMVAHTGNLAATIRAVEILDEAVGQIVETALGMNGAVIITADHGNAEELLKLRTGEVDKEHSTNPVPVYFVSALWQGRASGNGDLTRQKPVGILADIAPTILELFGLPAPQQMTGRSLLPLITKYP